MTEAPKLSQKVAVQVAFPEKYHVPLEFSGNMLTLSQIEVEEMAAYLKGVPSNSAIETTLKSIEHARLGGVGAFKDTLSRLTIPQKIEHVVKVCHIYKLDAHRTRFIENLNFDEASVLQEALLRARHQECASDHHYTEWRSKNIDALLHLVASTHPSLKELNPTDLLTNRAERTSGKASYGRERS